MAETYIQMFQEKYYPDIFREIAQETILQYVKNENQIIEQFENVFSRYLDQLTQLQKNHKIEAVMEIDISFLYTSLQEGKAQFRIDSYGEGGCVLEKSMATDYLPADWLIIQLDYFENKLMDCVEKQSLRRYIRPAAIEMLKLRAVRSLLYYFSFRFKYAIQDFLDLRRLAKVQKAESFVIQIGEYQDWQRVIYAILPEVDIFNCEKETSLRFRKFPAIYYDKRELKNLVLSQARFLDCTFTETEIENCNMNDCLFENCRFENVKFVNTQLKGCSFQNCTIRNTLFYKVEFYTGTEGEETEYFEPAEFYECDFSSDVFEECIMPSCLAMNCDAQEVEVIGGETADSMLLGLSGVVYRAEKTKTGEDNREE